jgi:hypothetical protein
MGRVADWWLNRKLDEDGDWRVPISNVQGFRPVGGYLIGTSTTLEFVPNRLEALVGASSWTAAVSDIDSVTLGRGRLRIVAAETAGGNQTLCTHRPRAIKRHLAPLLESLAEPSPSR